MTARARFALLLWIVIILVTIFSAATGKAATAPYIYGVDAGRVTVWYPGVPGYDSGLLQVLNTSTGEEGPLYLTWRLHVGDIGIYQTDPSQLLVMGSGYYIVTSGNVGSVSISNLPYGFDFQAWRAFAPVVMR